MPCLNLSVCLTFSIILLNFKSYNSEFPRVAQHIAYDWCYLKNFVDWCCKNDLGISLTFSGHLGISWSLIMLAFSFIYSFNFSDLEITFITGLSEGMSFGMLRFFFHHNLLPSTSNVRTIMEWNFRRSNIYISYVGK